MRDWLESLKKSGKLVIVEGKKDLTSLRELGIKHIITISRPLYSLVEDIARNHKDVVILTDLDKEGKRLYSILRQGLQKHGVRVDSKFREFLFKHTKLTQIEGIVRYLRNREKKKNI